MMDLNKIVEKIKIKTNRALGKTYQGNRNRKIVFVLSTGRCGSTSIKDVFNQHPKFLAFHEEIRPLIQISTQLAENPQDQNKIYKRLDNVFKNRVWEAKRNQILVHSDHRLWNLTSYLSDYFPNAHFIHLIRNPYDSVKSYVQRNWYSDSPNNGRSTVFDHHRLYGDALECYTTLEWNKLHQIDKCLWYWNYVNNSIALDLKRISNNRVTVIKLEELEDTMNHEVKNKFNISSEFRFQGLIMNKSKKELSNIDMEKSIESTINLCKNELFVDYYPNFKA